MNDTVRIAVAIISLLCGTRAADAVDCPGDLDGDGMVGGSDLGQLFLHWGTDASNADVNLDGLVDGVDFGLLLRDWGECPEYPMPAFIHGDPRLLADLHDGDASVLMIGDSISNWGSTNFTSLYHAAICTWKPVQWRGVHTSPAASGPQGHYVLSGQIASPGSLPAFVGQATDLSGQHTAVAEVFTRSPGASASSSFFSATIDHSIFSPRPSDRPRLYRIGVPFQNAAGAVDFVNSPGPVEAGFNFIVNGDRSAEGLEYAKKVRLKASRGGAVESATVEVDLANDGGLEILSRHLRWTSTGMVGSLPGLKTQVVGMGLEMATDFELAAIQDFYFGRPDRRRGLTLAYAGDGGWRIGNHLLPAGHPDTPFVGGNQPGFNDRALAARIKAVGATHYFIHLGANDFSPGSETTVATYCREIKQLVGRIREQSIVAGAAKPRFILLGLYLTGRDDEAVRRPLKNKVRSAMAFWADASNDLVYLDLAGYIESVFDMSDIDVANPFSEAWLLDQVHLNPLGAESIGHWIWSRVRESVEATR